MSTRLSPRLAYALVAAVIGLALFASGTPSPLYATYRELWGFSSVVLTLVYATYAFGVLASLVFAGRISDQWGRRPVLLLALSTLLATSVLFMFASSVAWLFVARGIQGLATGLALGAASAALLDLHPRRDTAGVGLTNGVASTAGMGLGVLLASLLVQFAPAPRVLPYVTLAVLFAVALVGAWLMPEPVVNRSRPRLTLQKPSIPPVVRRPFVLAALGVVSSWSIGGLFLSLGPSLSATLFHTSNHLVTGLGVFALAGSGAVAQLVFGRSRGLGRRGVRLARARRGHDPDRALGRHGLRGALLGRRRDRRRRVRRRVPRRPARALRGDPRRAPRIRDVGVLHRRLRVDLDPGDPRGLAREHVGAASRPSSCSAR